MAARLVGAPLLRDHALRDAGRVSLRRSIDLRIVHLRRPSMHWTTPTATDLRFGFEITMYVSAR